MPIDPEVIPTPEEAIEAFRVTADVENDPMVLYSGENHLTVMVLNSFGPRGIAPMLQAVLPKVIEDAGPPRWVVLCAEAWSGPPTEGRDHLHAGELQERAEAGDESVTEVVIANGFSKDQEFSATQPFTRRDGEVVWGELEVLGEDGKLSGAVPDILRPLFA